MSVVRRILGFGAAAGAVAIALVQACGLGVTGTSTEAGAIPLGAGDGGFPEACATLDASCVGALPPGWIPLAVDDAGCPPAFTPGTLKTNPRLREGGCMCGVCEVDASGLSCPGSVVITSGNGCMDSPPLGTTTSGACLEKTAQHVEAHPPDASGTPTCVSPAIPGAGATGDPLAVCVPSCAADVCAARVRCAYTEGESDCPPGFTLLARAGTEVAPHCDPCGCEAGLPSPACTGTVTAFARSACDDAGGDIQIYPVAECDQFPGNQSFASLFVALVPPDAACAPTAPTPGTGDASLAGVKTVCCR